MNYCVIFSLLIGILGASDPDDSDDDIVVFQPEVSEVPVRILTFGDWGNPDRISLIDGINIFIKTQRLPIDAVVLLGDNFYPYGINPHLGVNDPLFGLFDNHLAANLTVPFFVALGNHDYLMGPDSARAQLEYSHRLWRMPSKSHFFDYKFPNREVRICVWIVDSVGITTWELINLKLEMRRMSRSCRWKIFASHYPPVTVGTYKQCPVMSLFRERIVKPLHEEFHFDLILAGHEHSSQIIDLWDTKLLIAGAPVETRIGSLDPSFLLPDDAKFSWGNDEMSGVVLLLEISLNKLEYKFVDVTESDEDGVLSSASLYRHE